MAEPKRITTLTVNQPTTTPFLFQPPRPTLAKAAGPQVEEKTEQKKAEPKISSTDFTQGWCLPALLNAALTVVAALGSFVAGDVGVGFIILIVGLVVTLIMRQFCIDGKTWIAWLILVIPILLFIYAFAQLVMHA